MADTEAAEILDELEARGLFEGDLAGDVDTLDIFGPVISSYSRAQAMADGYLVNVSAVAREAGIKFPVAVTRGVWDRCIEVPAGVVGQDEMGRMWDVVWMLRVAIGASRGGDLIEYRVLVRNDNRERTPPAVDLVARCGAGDTPEPVITIMLPGED